ncbi:MAG: flagellar brake protein [Lachnospiraceae bacterium]|nr:flagellar brake protein [Lachnospiraceae bacterium]
MISDYIIPGDKIEMTVKSSIERPNRDGIIARKVYRTRIYDIVSEDEIKVNMPMDKDKLILLPIDSEYDLCFYTQNGLYQCYGRVTDRYKSKNIYVLVLELTTPLKKFQRREYYRLNCILNMKCRKMEDEEYEVVNDMNSVQFINTDLTLQNGTIVDISGGGARFISKTYYPPESKILFKFALPGTKEPVEYEVVGRVLGCEEAANMKGVYQNHVQFIKIDVEQRESIIKYIFEEERRKRRRERGE